MLATQALKHLDENGTVREVVLTVYMPLQAKDETWRCAFALGFNEEETIRCGVGADFIESLLDGLALARATYEAMIPNRTIQPESEEFMAERFLPYKLGRAYGMEPVEEQDADAA